MKNTGTLKVTASGERDVLFERVFEAPRAAVLGSGMEHGAAESYDRLAALLK